MGSVFCITLGILCIIGVIANIFLLKCICNDMYPSKSHKKRPRRGSNDPRSPPKHVYVYIGALLISDLLLLINCPFIVHDVFYESWSFGWFLCKFVYGNESYHKALTGFLVAALSFDQLITVRKILSPKWRSISKAFLAIGCFVVINVILQLPVFMYTGLSTFDDPDTNIDSNQSIINDTDWNQWIINDIASNQWIINDIASNQWIINDIASNQSIINDSDQTRIKCGFTPPDGMENMEESFTILLFGFAFCTPALVILISYATIIQRMIASGYCRAFRSRSKFRTTIIEKGNAKGCRMITGYVSMLVLIYLFCWAPYWILTVLPVGLVKTGNNQLDDVLTNALLYIHLLPYVNATLNPMAYGYLICGSKHPIGFACLFSYGEREREDTGKNGAWSLEETWKKQTVASKVKTHNASVL